MINKTDSLPLFDTPSAEAIKTENLFYAYKDQLRLFSQDTTGAVIALLDGNAIISGTIKPDEAKSFLRFTGAKSVFSTSDNLCKLYGENGYEKLNVLVLWRPPLLAPGNFGDDLSSRDIYGILNVPEFNLPPYEYFATDYCLRKNHGLIKVFARRDICAAITLEGEKYRLLAGIVSRQKGRGGALLQAAVCGKKPVLAVCRDELIPFYAKFGFEPLYTAGLWRKDN
ncbi:MAG: GNAT family N-acetyltransferase [Clostridia bacterium]|nr:GNAT family N-acetyltransferase [Clostridia bacterium]